MIAWVDEQCRAWGAHKRWLTYGQASGWPSRSLLGKLIEQGPGAGHIAFSSSIPHGVHDAPESFVLIERSLERMQRDEVMVCPSRVVWAHYFFGGRVKQKCRDMDLPVRTYWQHLHAAHAFIVACRPDVPRLSDLCAQNLQCA